MADEPAATGADDARAGVAAHDLNNALAIVVNYSSFVDKALEALPAQPDPAQLERIRLDLDEVQTAAEHARRLAAELASLIRPPSG